MYLCHGAVPWYFERHEPAMMLAIIKGANNMRSFALTLTVAVTLGFVGVNGVRGEEPGVAHIGCGACPPPQIISECPQTCKVCISQTKPTTQVEHSSVCKDYCRPHCGLGCLFHNDCNGCEDGCENCGKVRTRHVLTKRSVPGCNVKECVVREQLVPQCQVAPPCGYLPAPPKTETVPAKPAPAK